jgi:hypothetical protein
MACAEILAHLDLRAFYANVNYSENYFYAEGQCKNPVTSARSELSHHVTANQILTRPKKGLKLSLFSNKENNGHEQQSQ